MTEQPAIVRERIGKYVLMERVGHGGMAEVFRARMFGPGGFAKDCAIKRILPTLLSDEQFVKMFIDEARLTASLAHPNIVQVLELGELEQSLFIAMEFISGKDLLDVLALCARRARRVPRELVLHIMMELLKALDYAHHATDEQGRPMRIVHRDVSPSNVLISYSGNVKISDFGIARSLLQTNRTEAGTQKGKMGYMSPEQVTGVAIDARCDLFAASVIFFEMLTMSRLFKADNDLEVMLKIRDGKIEEDLQRLRSLPADLQFIVRKGLQQNPAERFQTANEFHTAIARFVYRNELDVSQTTLEAFMREMFADKIAEEQAVRALDPKSDPGQMRIDPLDSLPPFRYRDEDGRIHGPMTFGMLSELLESRSHVVSERVSVRGGPWLELDEVDELRAILRRGEPPVVALFDEPRIPVLSGENEAPADLFDPTPSGTPVGRMDEEPQTDETVEGFLEAAAAPESTTPVVDTLDARIDQLLKDYLSGVPRDSGSRGASFAGSGSASGSSDPGSVSAGTLRRNADWEELSRSNNQMKRRQERQQAAGVTDGGLTDDEAAVASWGIPALRGGLDLSSVARLLIHVHMNRRSGLLQIVGAHQHREMFFDDGMPTVVFSSVEEEMLGYMLVRQGVASHQQVMAALADMNEEDPTGLGDEVVRRGWLAPHQLYHLMSEQMREKIMNAIFVTDGEWRWWPGARPLKPTVNLPLNLPSLVNRTIQEYVTAPLIERHFHPRLQMRVRMAGHIRELSQLPLAPKALRMAQRIAPGRTVAELQDEFVNQHQMKSKEFLQLLYLLTQFGAAILEGEPTEPLPA
jgi:serine/threonine protein kinase